MYEECIVGSKNKFHNFQQRDNDYNKIVNEYYVCSNFYDNVAAVAW